MSVNNVWKQARGAAVTVGGPLLLVGGFFLFGFAGLFLIFFAVPAGLKLLAKRKRYDFKRLQKILPTSRIRSVASGLAEIEGRVVPDELLAAPMDGTPCVGYRYLVEKRRTDSDGDTTWVRVSERSDCVAFELDDGTGRMQVQADGLRLKWLQEDRVNEQINFRHTQWLLKPDERVLIIGEARRDGGQAFMVKDEVRDMFTLAPADLVERYNHYRPLFDAALMYLGLIGLLTVLILLSSFELDGNRLLIDWLG